MILGLMTTVVISRSVAPANRRRRALVPKQERVSTAAGPCRNRSLDRHFGHIRILTRRGHLAQDEERPTGAGGSVSGDAWALAAPSPTTTKGAQLNGWAA